MGKTAFLFSGQGAQKVGMAKDVAERYPAAMEVFDRAGEALGFDIKQMIWEGDAETLMITENTQPCVVTAEAAILAVLWEKGVEADVTAGLSLGEYSAHIAARSVTFEDAVRLVRKRGKYMQEAVPLGVGGMAAILGLANEDVEAACREAQEAGAGYVAPTNYNCPGQLVIAGEKAAVEKACEIASEKGAKRAKPLPVSAPFHCALLEPAGEKLAGELEKMPVSDMRIPVYTNVTAQPVPSADDIRDILVKQVSSPVRFEATIRNMIADGVDTFVEIGPGKTLTSFVKKINRDVTAMNAEDEVSLQAVLAYFGKE